MSATASTTAPTVRVPTTPEPSHEFADVANEERIQATVAALEANGIHAIVASDRADAVRTVLGLVPPGSTVLDATSQTLSTLGVPAALAGSKEVHYLRDDLVRLHQENRGAEARRLGAAPDVVIGSVHALTESGEAVIASASGSQIGPYVYSAGRVVWVVGAQKIVPDLATAIRRVHEHVYPLENERAKKVYGRPSFVAKLLVVQREFQPGRITVVLLRESLGF